MPETTFGTQRSTSSGQAPACFHCGQPCSEQDILLEGRHFCCMGCKTVYELLSSREMCAYYDLSQGAPGISPSHGESAIKYGYLDDPGVIEKIVDFHDGSILRATFSIPTMHCASCIYLLENLHELRQGIRSARVNFLHKELTVTWDQQQLPLRELVALLASIGYEPHLSLEAIREGGEKKTQRSLIMRVGVAGFAFGNIMLLSFPEYLASGAEVDGLLQLLFRYLNFALALPVLLYSAQPYWSSAFKGLRARTVNLDVPITIGIAALFLRSAYEVIAGVGPGYFDSLAGLLFLLLIGRIFQEKTYAAFSFERDYSSYFPLAATLLEASGLEKSVPVSSLKPGARIVVRNQELIPADAVLINGDGRIDYGFVTGESEPVLRRSGDLIHAGGRQVGSAIELEVMEEVSRSHLVRLWNQDAFTRDRESRYTILANRISRYFTAAVLLIATAAFLLHLPSGMGKAVWVLTAVLIVACPCALALATPFTLGTAMRLLGRFGFYLKKAEVVENLAAIRAIAFDKTGTLTVAGSGHAQWEGEGLGELERALIRSIVRHSTHPLSLKIFASLEGGTAFTVDRVEEVSGYGLLGEVAGHVVRVGSAAWVGADEEHPVAFHPADGSLSVAWVAVDGHVLGRYRVANLIRPGLDKVIEDLSHEYELTLISGDTDRDKPILAPLFGEQNLHFRQGPHEKLQFIEEREQRGEHLLMIGDGLNDAGALRAASVGVAVTEDVTSFSPACDGLLAAESLKRLRNILHFSRHSVAVIKVSFAISFAYNLVGLSFAVAGKLSPLISAVLMPVSSITVVAVATGLTTLAARKSLGGRQEIEG